MARKTEMKLLEDEKNTLLLAIAEKMKNDDIKELMATKHNRKMDDPNIDYYRKAYRDEIAGIQIRLFEDLEDSFSTTNVAFRIRQLESIAHKLKGFMDVASDAKEYKSLSSEYCRVLRQVQEEMDKLGKKKPQESQNLADISDEDFEKMKEQQAERHKFFSIKGLKSDV